MTPPIIESVVARHAEDAAFLWLLRDRAVRAPHYTLAQLAELDQRVDAHLDGLRIAGNAGWNLCGLGLEDGGPGELFLAATLGFEERNDERIRGVLEKGPTAPPRARAVVSALGWLPYERVKDLICKLVEPGPVPLRYVGIAASAVHRRQPDYPIPRALSGDPWLDARIFRAIGELGVTDDRTFINKGLASADETCRFWAAWSGALIHNEPAALRILQSLAAAGGPFAEAAARMTLRRLDLTAGRRWFQHLAATSRRLRIAIIAAGAAGDPESVPWLIEQMKSPPLARVAGEAFTMITGVDIAQPDLEGARPKGYESGPMDDPVDVDVAMDPDEQLPWPNPLLVQAWWDKNKSRFPKATRHLLGQPMTPERLWEVLRIGRQRQRAAAAMELAIRQPGQPLFEVRAPGFRQQQLLAAMGRTAFSVNSPY